MSRTPPSQAPPRWLTAAILVLAGLAGCSLLTEGSLADKPAGAGGGGAEAACTTADDCPGAASTCAPLICDDGVCRVSHADEGKPCTESGGDVCDGTGVCVKAAATACLKPSECQSSFCVDGFCCESACDSRCASCAAADTGQTDGTCAPVAAGADPDDECTDSVCDGGGACASCDYQGVSAFENSDADLDGNGVATDADNAIVLVGTFKGDLAMDDGSGPPLLDNGKLNGLVAKYDSGGTHLWSFAIGNGTHDLTSAAVATDHLDSIVVTGAYKGTLDLGLGALEPELPGKLGVYTAKYDGAGSAVWARGVGNDAQDMSPEDVAVDGSGHVFITGRYKEATDFYDGHTVPAQGAKLGVYLAKYDGAAGTTLWSQGFGNTAQDQLPGGVAASASGDVVVVGSYKGTVDFGGGAVLNLGTHAGIFVAAYDGNGDHRWSHGYSNTTGSQLAEDVVIDAAGNVVVVGSVLGTLGVGGDELSAPTRRHVLVAKYDSAGNHLWSHAFGSATGDSTARSVAVDADGNVIVAGRFGGAVAFGETSLTSLGATQDAFVLTLAPNGAHLCSFGYGNDTETTYAEGVAADGTGDLRIVGHFLDPVDFGSDSVTPTELGKYAIYLLRYQR